MTVAESPPREAEILDWQQYCFDVTRASAKNFFYGMKLTPEPKRSAMYTIYAFMRACDDLADDADPNDPESVERVETFRRQMLEACGGQPLSDGLSEYARLWPSFRIVVKDYGIEAQHLNDMLDGQRSDLAGITYHTFDDLYQYCYRVASVVGLVCIQVWGHDNDPAVKQLAEYRGIALQLTNILRDVVEDAERGRVYLPADDMKRFGYDPALITKRQGGEAFEKLMSFQIDRAREYYDRSAILESHINPGCRAACSVITRIYRELLEKIATRPAAVLETRVSISRLRKVKIALSAALRSTAASIFQPA